MQKNKKKLTSEQALKRLQNICSKQEKCIFDIKNKLFEWQIDSCQTEKIISTLIEQNFVNEERYTEFFVKDKLNINKWGKRKIEYILKHKQIHERHIKKAFQNIEHDDYKKTIEKEITKKYTSLAINLENTSVRDKFILKNKILRFAESRGYETEITLEILSKIIK